MKLGCRWDTDPPCKLPVSEYRRIILDVMPVAFVGFCKEHLDVFDRAVSRGGVVVIQEINQPVRVRLP